MARNESRRCTHAKGGNLGRRRKNARTVCYRLFPGKMGRDAADPCRGDGSRDPTLCLKTVVSTRGRPLCSLSLSPRPVAAILDRERDPTPYRFSRWKRKFGYLFSLHRKQDLSLFLFDFVNSTRLTFNVTNCRDLLLSIIIHRIPLKGRAIHSPRDLRNKNGSTIMQGGEYIIQCMLRH